MANLDKETAAKLKKQDAVAMTITNGKEASDYHVGANANDIVCELLVRLGYTETATEFRKFR